VQKLAATLSMYQNIFSAVPAVLTSLFLGPWSDVHGRKPLMILPMIGTVINQFIYMANTYFTSLKAEFILLTCLGSLFGGFTCFLVGMYSYITDVSRVRSRTSRVAFLDLFMFLGFPIGVFISGPVFKFGSYYATFGLVRITQLLNSSQKYILIFSVSWIYIFGSIICHAGHQGYPWAKE
jgi:MFS family permease